MQNLVNEYQEKFSAERKARRRVTSLFLALAMVVGLGVSWRLKMTGIAMTEEPVLATAETAAAVPVAAQATADTAASAPAQQVAVTPDLGADLETESDWTATLPQLAGTDWAADLVAVAESQLGYAESTRNFAVADDGVTLNGYTRYGAWYGNPRGEWNGMFAAFCLHYAGVPDAYMPSAAGAFAFTAALADKGLYHSAGYTPVAGDLVFFGVKNEDGTAAANRVGIVDKAETDENGTLQLTVIEGDLDNAVKTAQYAAGDGAIVGYGSLAEAFAQYKADTGAAADPKAAASAAATPETAWQAGSLRYVDTDYTVIVAYSESSRIPADASLSVRELEKGSDEYNTYYQKTVAALVTNGTAASASDVRLSFIRLFDVNILQNGQKLEPATPVQISIVYAQPFATPENAVAERQIVHFANAGTEIIDPKVTTMPDGQQSVAYRQGSFSIIADTAALNPESTTLFSADPVNPIDLSSYIQGAVLQKQVNGVWTAATEFNNGDSFKGTLYYTISQNIVTANNRVATYQLPGNIALSKESAGNVLDSSNQVVGTYKISQSGLATITYNESFSTSKSFAGTLALEGTMSNTSTTEDATFKFGNTEYKVHAKVIQYDTKIQKKGSVADLSDGTITYTVEVSTTNGTGPVEQNLSFNDTLINAGDSGASYIAGSLNVTKKAGEISSTPTYSTPALTGSSFSITDLKNLAAGETYTITYQVKTTKRYPDGSWYVKNKATANTANSGEVWTTLSNSLIHKEGVYDNMKDAITWTIKINAGKNDIQGYAFTDTLPDGLAFKESSYRMISEDNSKTITISPSDTNNRTLSYTFPNVEDKNTYNLTFTTTAPVSNGSVKNTAFMKHNSVSYNSDGTVNIVKRGTTLDKQFSNVGTLNGSVVYNWTTNVGLPAGAFGSVTYKDTIQDATDADGNLKPNTHYGLAKDLDGAIKNSLKYTMLENDTAKTLSITELQEKSILVTIQYFDANNKLIDNTNNTTPIRTFTPDISGTGLTGVSMSFGYPTVAGRNGITAGQTWTYKNSGEVNGKNDTDQTTYTKQSKLQKSVSTIAKSFDYDEIMKTGESGPTPYLIYTLTLQTDINQTGPITVTDKLPAGLEYMIDWAKITLYSGNDKVKSLNSPQYTDEFGEIEPNYYSANAVQNADGTTDITFVIQDGYNSPSSTAPLTDGRIITILYYAKLQDQDYWNDLSHTSKAYINTAKWNGEEVANTATVTRPVDVLKKTAEQVKDENKNNTYAVDYSVVINPAKKDLNTSSDVVTLVDTLTPNDTSTEATLDLSTVKLYEYDFVTKTMGSLMDASQYHVVNYDSRINQMTIEIPDKQSFLLKYRYTYKSNLDTPTLSNTVTLQGQNSNTISTTMQKVTSTATVARNSLTIDKVDSKDWNLSLSGAKFKLEYYDVADNTWKNNRTDGAEDIYTTNSAGTIVLSQTDTQTAPRMDYVADRLYRITETAAPMDYTLSAKSYYFIWKNLFKPETNAEAFGVATGNKLGNEVLESEVYYSGISDNTTLYVPNDYSSLSVKKLWQDENGNNRDAFLPNVHLQLMRQAKSSNGHQVRVEYGSSGGSSREWGIYNVADNQNMTISVPGAAQPTSITSGGKNFGTIVKTDTGYTVTTNQITENCTISILIPLADGVPTIRYKEPTYTAAGSLEPYEPSVTVSANGSWTYKWETLPAKDAKGNYYFYSVKEVDENGHEISSTFDYVVSYSNPEGVQNGKITLTNVKTKKYNLPKTGGAGTIPYTAGGAALMAVSLLAGYNIRRKRKGGQQS